MFMFFKFIHSFLLLVLSIGFVNGFRSLFVKLCFELVVLKLAVEMGHPSARTESFKLFTSSLKAKEEEALETSFSVSESPVITGLIQFKL